MTIGSTISIYDLKPYAQSLNKASQTDTRITVDGVSMGLSEYENRRRLIEKTAKNLIKSNANAIASGVSVDKISEIKSFEHSGDFYAKYQVISSGSSGGNLSSPFDRPVLLSGSMDGGSRYFGGILDKEFDVYYDISDGSKKSKLHYMAAKNTKERNLNDYAESKYLQTPYGEVEILLDMHGGDESGIVKFESNATFFNFDSNGDGLVDDRDEYFTRLKARGYDKDGNEKIVNLSDLVSEIDLRKFIKEKIVNHNMNDIDAFNEKQRKFNKNNPQFIDKSDFDYRITEYASNPYTLFKAEYRYKEMSKDDVKYFFESFANKDGWVDLRKNNVFNKNSSFKNFAYLKAGFDNNLRLSEFNPIIQAEKGLEGDFSYVKFQRTSFYKFYDDYQKESQANEDQVNSLINDIKAYGVENSGRLISSLKNVKSPKMIAMEKEFEKATGLKFSVANMNIVKREFQADDKRAAMKLRDADSVIAMKLNENGSITLKFDSGRELVVTRLFTDTGKVTGKNALLEPIKPDNDIKVKAPSAKVSESVGKNLRDLKEVGVDMAKGLSRDKILLRMLDGRLTDAGDILNVKFMNDFLNGEKNMKKIDLKDRFYRKINFKA